MSVATSRALRSRREKVQVFQRELWPTETTSVIDVGVSSSDGAFRDALTLPVPVLNGSKTTGDRVAAKKVSW